MKIENLNLQKDKKFQIIRLSFSNGKKQLLTEGFKQCANQLYYQKDNIIIHYNNTLKYWIVENK